jgi:hypothetical protein
VALSHPSHVSLHAVRFALLMGLSAPWALSVHVTWAYGKHSALLLGRHLCCTFVCPAAGGVSTFHDLRQQRRRSSTGHCLPYCCWPKVRGKGQGKELGGGCGVGGGVWMGRANGGKVHGRLVAGHPAPLCLQTGSVSAPSLAVVAAVAAAAVVVVVVVQVWQYSGFRSPCGGPCAGSQGHPSRPWGRC